MLADAPFADTGAEMATSSPSSKVPLTLRTSTKEPTSTVAGSTSSSKVTSTDAGKVMACAPSAGAIALTDNGSLSIVTFTPADVVSLPQASLACAVITTAPSGSVAVSQSIA